MEWHSVKDKAPEFGQWVWAYSAEYDPARAHILYLHPHLGWIDPEYGDADPLDSKVTHWMMLPLRPDGI